MWWEFHRLMGLTPEELVDEGEPIGLLEPVGPIDAEQNGRQTWRYRFPAQDHDIGRGAAYDPAKKQARPDDKPFGWTCGDVVAVDPAGLTVDLRRPGLRGPSPVDRRARLGADQGPPGRLVRPRLVGRGTWDPGDPAPIRAGRDLLFRLPPRTGQWLDEPLRHDRRVGARGCPATGAHPRPQHACDPGPARVRQDVHRCADGRSTAGRGSSGSGSPRNSHKVIGNMLTRRSWPRPRRRERTSGPSSGVRPIGCWMTRASSVARAHQMSGHASTTAGPTWRPARPGCGPRPRWPGRSTSWSSTKRGRSRLANVVACAAAASS